jgi:uncharacterized lipoprotein YmbA
MTHARSGWWRLASALGLALAGCGSVEVPVEQFYRLELPPVAAPDPQCGGVLRVHDLQLHTALDSSCLQQLDGVRLQPRPLARWIAPLDRLVTDSLVLGLSRARVTELVKGGADAGDETWSLRGRIVDFVEATGEHGPEARVTLELWLEARDRLLFCDEFAVREPIGGPGADAAVAALARGVVRIVGDVVARMRAQDLFAAARAAGATGYPAAPAR